MPSPEKFSDYLSIFAVLLSSLSLYLSWRNFRRDASRLSVRLKFKAKVGQGSAYRVRVTNVGRWATTLRKLYARLKGGKRYPVFETPTKLEETEEKDILVPLVGFSVSHPLDIRAFEAEDATGKTYKARTWRLWRQIREVWKPDIDLISDHKHSRTG